MQHLKFSKEINTEAVCWHTCDLQAYCRVRIIPRSYTWMHKFH